MVQKHGNGGEAGLYQRLKSAFAGETALRTKSVPSWYAGLQSYVQQPGKPVWSGRSYVKFAEEAYRRNVIAYRAINLIAKGASSIALMMYEDTAQGERQEVAKHPLLRLVERPLPLMGFPAFMEAIATYRLLGGNAYVLAVGPVGEAPRELHLLRPDRVSVLAGKGSIPAGYRYKAGEEARDFPVDPISGMSRVLHIKEFHPSDDWYGLSPVEAAAYSIDQHNQAAAWNQSLLQNGARPSGALVVRTTEGGVGQLSEDQYWRIKNQMDEQFSGAANAGRPLLLEGGLDWREMSLSPKDMDFIAARSAAARDIALAFGVPPQMLGIPGDNTHSNLAEARLALWEQTILPLVSSTLSALSEWLSPMFGGRFTLSYDEDAVTALSPRRDALWARVKDAAFLSDDEKRVALGYGVSEGQK